MGGIFYGNQTWTSIDWGRPREDILGVRGLLIEARILEEVGAVEE